MKANYGMVKKKVKQILEENRIRNIPISPREIAEAYGIQVEFVQFKEGHKDIAGFFIFKEKKIYINSEEPYNRNTFSIAHELGHYFLHKEQFEEEPNKYEVLFRKPMGAEKDPIEQEANAFAANLLVPEEFLEKYKNSSIAELSQLFAVSPEVIRNRLKIEYGYR